MEQVLWRLISVAVVIAGFASSNRGRAFAGPAIEQYEEIRPEEAGPIMNILRTELESRGTEASPSQLAHFMLNAPTPSVASAGLTSAVLMDELERAVKSFLHVNYEAAAGELELALTRSKDNPGLVVNDERTQSEVARAQIALALAYRNLGDRKKAVQAMTEYIRSTSESIPKMFGPPGEEFYREVKKLVEPIKRGTLMINVSEPEAQIFVNGRTTGRGSTFAGSLLPGKYCVVAQVGSVSLRYDVSVFAESETTLQINWSFESTLHVSTEWVGLILPKGAQEVAFVPGVARMIGQQTITVVGIRRGSGYLAIFGSYYDFPLTGHVARSGEVHIPISRSVDTVSARSRTKLAALAQYLATAQPSADVVPVGAPEPDLAAQSIGPPPHPYEHPFLVPALVGGTGVVALAIGMGLQFAAGPPPVGQVQRSRLVSTPGVTLIASGSVVIGVGVYLWVRATHRASAASTPTVSVMPGGGTIGWAGRF